MGVKCQCAIFGSSISLKDTIIDRDQKAQFCRGIGCSGRIKYSQNTKIRKSDEVKCPKRSFHSSSAKQIIGSSSQTCGVMTNARKSHLDSTRKFPVQPEFHPSESSVLIESEAPELLPSPSRIRSCLRNLKCNSLADVIPGSGSTSELNSSRRDVMKKRSSEGESSLSRRGEKTTRAPSVDTHISPSTSGISVSDQDVAVWL
ncbi:uncharacterized protein Fot_13801 [Forsythia ovata]|uniref:Uncharacterized protein n=1 Tax=Forsythia ovata TaxID=205694 RepID=A0ABD1W6S6_9LAMI